METIPLSRANSTELDVCGIYRIICAASGKSYVGSAEHIRGRVKHHVEDLKAGEHNTKFQSEFNEFGIEAFNVTVVERCLPSELISREQYYLDCTSCELNVRKRAESNLGFKRTLEDRAKQSATRNKIPFTPEYVDQYRLKLSEEKRRQDAWVQGRSSRLLKKLERHIAATSRIITELHGVRRTFPSKSNARYDIALMICKAPRHKW
jgi:group I intron endonuclease